MADKIKCPYPRIREYPGCFEDCPDTDSCPKHSKVDMPVTPTPDKTQELRKKLNMDLNAMFFIKHRERLGIPWLYANEVDGLADHCIDIFNQWLVEQGALQPTGHTGHGYYQIVEPLRLEVK